MIYVTHKTRGAYMVSDRNRTMLRHVADGLNYRQVAEAMGLSMRSITQYMWYLKFDLDAKSVCNLISIAYDIGILEAKPFLPPPERRAVIWKKPRQKYLQDNDDMLTGWKGLSKTRTDGTI